jgi:peroxiredoxin (alkyl hydroperoxide reductase subunit C)
MLADTSKSLAEELVILEANIKVAYRTTYIVDPQGIIRHISVNDLSVGRNIEEIVRLVDAFQNGGLTPCNWKKGEKTL